MNTTKEKEHKITMMDMKQNSILTSLEYAGLEALFQRIINACEDTMGIHEADFTPVSQITRRTNNGIEVWDGEHNIYQIRDFAVKAIYKEGDTCKLTGFSMAGQKIEDCFGNEADVSIDITPLLDEDYIDLEWLTEQLSRKGAHYEEDH